MPNTHGFEVVAEVTEGVLLKILQEAWKSGGDSSDEGVIPEYIPIPNGLAFGPYQIKEGFVQIPQEQLALSMNPTINGVDVKLGTIIHIEIDNPPIDSAKFFDLTADITIKTPIDTIDSTKNVGVILSDLPDDAIISSITSGDPIAPITNAAIEEYVHNLYQENGTTFPHTFDEIPVNFFPFSMKLFVELFDDPSDPAKSITVNRPASDKIEIRIPAHLRFYEITGTFAGVSLNTPMGILATIVLTADYEELSDRVIAHLSTATVDLVDIEPAEGDEGSNYTHNKTIANYGGYDLEANIINGFKSGLSDQLRTMFSPDPEVFVPTLQQIEDFISLQVRNELQSRKQIMVWQPEAPDGSDITINDVTPKALSDAMAIGINAGAGANADALSNFIPADRDFATALSEAKVREAIDKAIDEEYPDGFPHRFEDVNGHDADLNSLDISLQTGAIHMEGEVTVIDAILGSIDVDADFSANAGLEWQDGSEGGQIIEPFMIGEPDVDLSLLAWIISFLIGFITFGLVGGIIAIVVVAIAEGIAERIGGGIIRDEVTDQLKGIEAWPQTLDKIGTIEARFLNPIGIDPDGILVSGSLLVTSSYALTSVDFANSHGPYHGFGGSPIKFKGNPAKPHSLPFWDFEDGHSAELNIASHVYGQSGLYIAKHRIKVTEEGGATTWHFTKVEVKNVPPKVTVGADIFVNEGQEFEIIGHFTDPEWLEKHTARIDFGDNTKPVQATVTESNNPPEAKGEVRAKHAYCDNGVYTVTLTVEDQDGGIGTDTLTVRVNNVDPQVSLPEKLCVLKGQAVRLEAAFSDDGWCDKHTAQWDFGDGHQKNATIKEVNAPPQAKGTAEASHVYQCAGKFLSSIKVYDDDGGLGQASMMVHVNELLNPFMENGFRLFRLGNLAEGQAANEWQPFVSEIETLDAKAGKVPKRAHFSASEFVCRDGQRSQHIEIEGNVQAGILQTICTNFGWDYEFSAFYHLPDSSSGKARIGIDPYGGIDADSSDVVWIEADASSVWQNISVRATAKAEQITLFLGLANRSSRPGFIYWDRASLFFIQPFCPEKVCKPTCVDFNELESNRVFDHPFKHHQLTISPLGKQVRTSLLGEPTDQVKLAFPTEGVRFDFPQAVDEVKLTVNNYAGRLIKVRIFSENRLIREIDEMIYNEVKTLSIKEKQITAIEISGGKNEAAVVELCLCLPEEEDSCEETCVNFDQLKPNVTFSRPFEHKQLKFSPLGKQIHTGTLGDPQGKTKLIFPKEGLRVDFPQAVDEVTLIVNNYFGRTITFSIFSGDQQIKEITEVIYNQVKTIVFKEKQMTAVEIKGGDNEASLVEICLCLPKSGN